MQTSTGDTNRVLYLSRNTPSQERALNDRQLLIGFDGANAKPIGLSYSWPASSSENNTKSLKLQAPYGLYRSLGADAPSIIALHRNAGGSYEAFGPFATTEDAYDYFPEHSSPHSTFVQVFEVPILESGPDTKVS